MGDLDVLDERVNPSLLDTLEPGVVMIGLNISRSFPDEPFRNFHDPSPMANDFKIRFAFSGTEYWGAYMTDVIKDFVEPVSGRLLDHLRADPSLVGKHIDALREELADLGRPRPAILAFGGAAYDLLRSNLDHQDYSMLVPLTHYSHRISKENYREAVHRQIGAAQQQTATQIKHSCRAKPRQNPGLD